MTHGTSHGYNKMKCRCKECRAWGATWRVGRRAWFRQYKEATPCADCGGIFPSPVMDFDHLPGTTKRTNIAQMSGCNRETLEVEMAKCELVCANCHRLRTFARRKAYFAASAEGGVS